MGVNFAPVPILALPVFARAESPSAVSIASGPALLESLRFVAADLKKELPGFVGVIVGGDKVRLAVALRLVREKVRHLQSSGGADGFNGTSRKAFQKHAPGIAFAD